MDFLTDDDLSHSDNKGGEIKWDTLFVTPLKTKGQTLRLRPVVSYDNHSLYFRMVKRDKGFLVTEKNILVRIIGSRRALQKMLQVSSDSRRSS